MVAAVQSSLYCPKCRTAALKAPSSGTPVLRCYTCHGMWLGIEEAQALAVQGTLLDPQSMLPQKASGDAVSGMCPEGHGILSRARVELEESFYLERCSRCSGIWFDGGEWEKLASSHLLHHLDDLWDPEWQRKMRVERAQQRQRERFLRELGPELFDRIEMLLAALERHPKAEQARAYILERLG